MNETNSYDDHPEFADRIWYARSIVTLPDRMRKITACHCGREWYDAFRTVGADEIVRLRKIIDDLQDKLRCYEAQGNSPD